MTGRAPFISRLSLTGFRNYPHLTLKPDSRPVVLTGPNGAGKTNLLEAVSFLSPGRGLRRAPQDQIAHINGDGFWAVFADITEGGEATRIGIGLQPAANGPERSKKLRINQANAASAESLLDYLRILWLTPAMDGLFTGPAGDRRRFLDRLVLAGDPGHGRRVNSYEKALTGRNRLLDAPRPDTSWLDGLESQVAELGVAVGFARRELVQRLDARLYAESGPDETFPKAALALEGSFEQLLAAGERPAIEVEQDFRDLLRNGRRRDAAAGRTLDGPHRSDLLVHHRDKDMPAALASTGEQKALLIGLVLAHARLVSELDGRSPVLLLDEIAAHLDPVRRAALFDALLELGGQAWMTGTDPVLFEALGTRAQHMRVDGGGVTQIA
uniref:DNA replication/repair protein RecF n=1 Tax=Pararhizobium sp. IMCC3301 TaxID=3067904 RepID=UPI0027409882|nr:DNA replication/repair protein RecF [Pararhizobium sp. IMCC3301]